MVRFCLQMTKLKFSYTTEILQPFVSDMTETNHLFANSSAKKDGTERWAHGSKTEFTSKPQLKTKLRINAGGFSSVHVLN